MNQPGEVEQTAVVPPAEPAGDATKPVETPVAQPPEAGEAEKKESRFTKRVDELTREWRQAERERDQLRTELERLRTQPVQQQATGKPVPEQFKDYNEYVDALTDWKVTQAQSKVQQSFESQRQAEAQSRLVQNFEASEETARKLHDDYDAVTRNPELKVNGSMIETLSGFDMGPEVLYWLGKHPEEASRISRLPPKAEAAALAKIEAKLERLAQTTPTAAPPPPSTVRGSGQVEKKPEQMSDKEWFEQRAKQLKARRKG